MKNTNIVNIDRLQDSEKSRQTQKSTETLEKTARVSSRNKNAVKPEKIEPKTSAQSQIARSKTPVQPRKFAEGLCFKKLFFVFLIGSVIGALYEDVLIFTVTYFTTGTGEWMLHRGVIYGPFNVIYGFGAALMCWVLLRKPYENWQIFLLAAGIGGIVEYALSYFQELVTHTTSWDYHGMWLNLNGRTTIPFMAVWGLMGLVLVKVIYPIISRWIERIPIRTGEIIFAGLLIFMLIDMTISWSAVVRRALRHNNIPALTPVGEFFDRNYPDEFLVKYYPNMEWAEQK